MIVLMDKKKENINKQIDEITFDERENHEFMRVEGGNNPIDCLSVANSNYGDKFYEEVNYYYRSNSEEHPELKDFRLVLEFYK